MLKMLKIDPCPQHGILGCHRLNSSWPGIIPPSDGLLFLAWNNSAFGEFTLPGREYFCLRRVYSSWPGILLPSDGLLFLAGNTSAFRGFTLPGRNTSAFRGFTLPFREYSCFRMVYSSWTVILLRRVYSS